MGPLDQRRSPRQARTHAREEHQLARLEASVVGRICKSERDRAGGGIAVLVHVHDGLLLRNAEFPGGVIDDADVRLVRDVYVDIVHRPATLAKNRLRRAHHYPRCELEDLAPVALYELLGLRELARATARQPEIRPAPAVRAELEAEEAA